MKNLKFILIAILPVLLLTNCTEDLPTGELLTYPTIIFTGETTISLAGGETYVEPGVEALQGTEALPVVTTVSSRYRGYSGDVVGSDPDVYYVNYTATNADGFIGTAARTVIVPPAAGDLVTSLAGLYSVTTTRAGGESYAGLQMMIWPESANVYGISCTIGHFYADGRGFGPTDSQFLGAGSTITVNDLPTNDFAFTESLFGGFGVNVTITTMTVDAATKTITWHGSGNFGNAEWDMVAVQQ